MIIDSLRIDPVEMNTKDKGRNGINAVEDRIIRSLKKSISLAISLAYCISISIVSTLACEAVEIYAMGEIPQRINAYQDLVNLYLIKSLMSSQSGKDDDEIDE